MTDQKVTVVGRVIKKSKELLQYENKSGNTMRYFNIIIGNKEEATHLKCYQKHKFSMVREGLTYRFSNVIQKTDSLWVIQTSNIGIVAPVQCSVDPVPILPENEPASGRKRTISEAIGSPQKSTVCAKIAKVSPVSLKCEGILPVRCLGLVDETSTTKVALFKDLAEQEFVEGSVVELSGLYKKTYNGKEQLVASAATQCQFLSSDSVQVEVTEEVKDLFSNDIDFGTAVSTPILEDIEVISISDMHVYEACDYDEQIVSMLNM